MPPSLDRRQFLAGSVGAVALTSAAANTKTRRQRKAQEFYELRRYQIANAEKGQIVSRYLKNGLLPALNRMQIDRVGVFTTLEDAKDHTIHVLIPYPTLESFGELNPKLAADAGYGEAAAELFGQPMADPAYQRIRSHFMKAFDGIPTLEMPGQTQRQQPRIFEIRTYESHNEDAAGRKVHMFNDGEIELMREVKMAPVFFGEMLIGNAVPNLTYMLSAANMEEHKAHWQTFFTHPEWERMKNLPQYKDTVSKINNWFVKPADFSQI